MLPLEKTLTSPTATEKPRPSLPVPTGKNYDVSTPASRRGAGSDGVQQPVWPRTRYAALKRDPRGHSEGRSRGSLRSLVKGAPTGAGLNQSSAPSAPVSRAPCLCSLAVLCQCQAPTGLPAPPSLCLSRSKQTSGADVWPCCACRSQGDGVRSFLGPAAPCRLTHLLLSCCAQHSARSPASLVRTVGQPCLQCRELSLQHAFGAIPPAVSPCCPLKKEKTSPEHAPRPPSPLHSHVSQGPCALQEATGPLHLPWLSSPS